MLRYEFRSFDPEGKNEVKEIIRLSGDAGARSKAGRMAKRRGGPVDLARAGHEDWADRYLTTASPSEFHTSGYRFERLT